MKQTFSDVEEAEEGGDALAQRIVVGGFVGRSKGRVDICHFIAVTLERGNDMRRIAGRCGERHQKKTFGRIGMGTSLEVKKMYVTVLDGTDDARGGIVVSVAAEDEVWGKGMTAAHLSAEGGDGCCGGVDGEVRRVGQLRLS